MKGKVTILLTLIMVLLMATPTLAANLEFNGKPYQPKQAPSIESGVTRVTPDVIMNFLGCDVAVEGDSITITENDKTIQMTVGSTAAVVNGETLTMPLALTLWKVKPTYRCVLYLRLWGHQFHGTVIPVPYPSLITKPGME